MKLSRAAWWTGVVPVLAMLVWAGTPSTSMAAAGGAAAGVQKLAKKAKKHHHKHHHKKKGVGNKLGEKGKKVAFKADNGQAKPKGAAGKQVGKGKKKHHHHKGMGKGMKQAIEHLIHEIKHVEKEIAKKKHHRHKKMAAGKGNGGAGKQVGKKGKGKGKKSKFDAGLMKLLVLLEEEMEGHHKHPGHRMGEKKPQAFAKGNQGLTPTALKFAGKDGPGKGNNGRQVGSMIGKHKMHMAGFGPPGKK